jgi:hypothetical protein
MCGRKIVMMRNGLENDEIGEEVVNIMNTRPFPRIDGVASNAADFGLQVNRNTTSDTPPRFQISNRRAFSKEEHHEAWETATQGGRMG